MSEILSGLVKNLGFYKMLSIINIYSRRCTFSTLTVTSNLPTFKAHLAQVTRASSRFPEGRVIAPFLRRRPQVFLRVKVIMNLKRLIALLDNKRSVIRLYLFCFLLAFCVRGKMTNTISSSLRSCHIYRK